MNVLRMVNPIMPYTWGSKDFIQKLTGDSKSIGKPQAELWIGAHPKASSQIRNGEQLVDLCYIIAEDPNVFLGKNISRDYCDLLPFLLKVLAADQPLSVQVHPNSKQAIQGYKKEERLRIPIDAFNRNFKDALHKPELLVALTEFHAMCGFRDFKEMNILVAKYLPHLISPLKDRFISEPYSSSLREFFAFLLNLNDKERHFVLKNYLLYLRNTNPVTKQELLIKEWSIRLSKLYPDDIGILSPLLLNIFVLKPGQALFLQAGILHSYLHGAGMEIMANSDNVLRGGLTPKHVDKDELLQVVDFTPQKIFVIKPEKIAPHEAIYRTPAKEFCLSIIRHTKVSRTEIIPSNSPEVLFCSEGSFKVENLSQILTLNQGQSLFVPYEVEGCVIEGKGTIFRARVNC